MPAVGAQRDFDMVGRNGRVVKDDVIVPVVPDSRLIPCQWVGLPAADQPGRWRLPARLMLFNPEQPLPKCRHAIHQIRPVERDRRRQHKEGCRAGDQGDGILRFQGGFAIKPDQFRDPGDQGGNEEDVQE